MRLLLVWVAVAPQAVQWDRIGKGKDRQHTLTKKLEQGGSEETGSEREKQT